MADVQATFPEPSGVIASEVTTSISGAAYHAAFLKPDDCDALLSLVSEQPWSRPFKRRVQQYGYAYNYTQRNKTTAERIGPLPDWLVAVARKIQPFFGAAEPIGQVIVNEYLPGQGIASHVDHPECFGETVAILSLGSRVLMDFKQRHGSRRASQLLEPGSLLILSGDARYLWEHGIASRKSDRVDGVAIRRGRRISLTFRSVPTSG